MTVVLSAFLVMYTYQLFVSYSEVLASPLVTCSTAAFTSELISRTMEITVIGVVCDVSLSSIMMKTYDLVVILDDEDLRFNGDFG